MVSEKIPLKSLPYPKIDTSAAFGMRLTYKWTHACLVPELFSVKMRHDEWI